MILFKRSCYFKLRPITKVWLDRNENKNCFIEVTARAPEKMLQASKYVTKQVFYLDTAQSFWNIVTTKFILRNILQSLKDLFCVKLIRFDVQIILNVCNNNKTVFPNFRRLKRFFFMKCENVYMSEWLNYILYFKRLYTNSYCSRHNKRGTPSRVVWDHLSFSL